MSTIVALRPHGGSGVELFESALTVPYAAGMRTDTVPITGGELRIAGPRREPVVLARLRRPLADEAVLVRATVAGNAQPPVLFAPFSAAGTLLPLFRPALAPGSDGTGNITVTLIVHRVINEQRRHLRPSPGGALGAAASAALIEGVVLEGRFARLLYLGTLDKQRAIRMIREIAAARHQALAFSGGLDDTGLGLGVPRQTGDPEPDTRYRSRLAIYGPWRMPTPAGLQAALNGPGAPTDDNAGLPATFGIKHRFRIVEETNDLAIATKLVAVGPAGGVERDRFHQMLRTDVLVDIEHVTSPLVPAARRQRAEAIRTTLRTELTRATGAGRPQHLAPLVAATLDRAVRLVRALGHTANIRLNRAYDPAGGSRYELGLGVDLGSFTGPQLGIMANRVAQLAGGQGELALLAQALTPRPAADDPLGRWLFEPCGFRTVHPVPGGDVHLSPLPTLGQFVEGPSDLAHGQTAIYKARLLGGGAAGVHVRAQAALDATAGVFAANGLAPVPAVLTPTALGTALQTLSAAATSPPLPASLDAARAAGVVTVDAKGLATQLVTTFNLDQVVAFVFTQADLNALGTGAALRDALIARIDAFAEAGFYTSRALWDGSRLLVLASVSQLPGASGKLGEPPPAAFRWYGTRVPASQPGTADPLFLVQPRGGQATVRGGVPGLALLVCISYARRGLADPFEIRVELPDPAAVLDLDQYGYVMNLLEHLYPLGIEVNTFDIRRRHVDADGDGVPEFLTSRASRSYHRYRHRRPFGSGRGRDTRGSAT